MNSFSDQLIKQLGRLNSKKSEVKQHTLVVEWVNNVLPHVDLPQNASTEELRSCLIDGTVLLQILDRLKPGYLNKVRGFDQSTDSGTEKLKLFLSCMDELGIPMFEIADLEKGSMKAVVDCLLMLRAKYMHGGENYSAISRSSRSNSDLSSIGLVSPPSREEKWKASPDSKFQQTLRSNVKSEPSAALMHHVGHKFQEVFQLKQGRHAKMSEMMKSNSLDNAPTQSLLSVVNGILDESIERKNGEIPQRGACLLRKVVQEIERRISTQAEHLRTQNNLFKAREEKYQSRISVLETLASGTGEESGIVMDHLQQTKEEAVKLLKEKEEDTVRLLREKEQKNLELSALKQELEIVKKTHEMRCLQMETETKGSKVGLEAKVKELEHLLEDSRSRMKVLDALSKSKSQNWNKKEDIFRSFMEFQIGAIQELRSSCGTVRHDIVKVQMSYNEEVDHLGLKLKTLVDANENYHLVLAENRKMFNELQDLKGNIRVYCRIRPFLPGQPKKGSIIEYIGEDGELIVSNPSKQGKDGQRMFRFNKVYGPDATQAAVFSDTKTLIRCILDGYNVCIFAYGQTGSGKTYTMTGPDGATEEDWGVNYRALNDLFAISRSRSASFTFEVGVQMVEIYNEQVRDLLATGVQISFLDLHTLGIMSTSQATGLAVPNATILPVASTSDVLEVMDIGIKNKAVSATAMNERSSRSHSVVSINVRGKDLHTGGILQGNLHLVDLAGSERVDRSEVTGDRLKEAQHINKSLSALGDVIFALAQKSSHVPYRNSKLTQLLQSSLGGQAKTLMFVQLNPDASSYSETMSTLKFAERVSGVELGAARSSKEGKDVRELMEQVASLKDTISKKDEQIERLQLLKDPKHFHPGLNGENAASDEDNTEKSDKHYGEAIAQDSAPSDVEISESGDGDNEDRLCDISDSVPAAGNELDGSTDESTKLSDKLEKSKLASKIRSLQKLGQAKSAFVSASRDSSKAPTNVKKIVAATTATANSSVMKPPKRLP
ncbi:hypothetical protein K2173_028204 [Erythroxylum novogranatense]|uniref:Uncharacterized protein n=1 Tax=Erythroxylum novogranatense TaxID=1862640 RepID=A0AAV8U172_9ROSI|nr:hypothetical protein K2173_028204 [Erythroxylum novogranatense]